MSELGEIFHFNEEVDVERKIVEQLLNEENLDTKTEMNSPLRWACMNSIRDYLEKKNLNKSKQILELFMQTSYRYLISNKRKGRSEYIEALRAISNKVEELEPKRVNPLNPMAK